MWRLMGRKRRVGEGPGGGGREKDPGRCLRRSEVNPARPGDVDAGWLGKAGWSRKRPGECEQFNPAARQILGMAKPFLFDIGWISVMPDLVRTGQMQSPGCVCESFGQGGYVGWRTGHKGGLRNRQPVLYRSFSGGA